MSTASSKKMREFRQARGADQAVHDSRADQGDELSRAAPWTTFSSARIVEYLPDLIRRRLASRCGSAPISVSLGLVLGLVLALARYSRASAPRLARLCLHRVFPDDAAAGPDRVALLRAAALSPASISARSAPRRSRSASTSPPSSPRSSAPASSAWIERNGRPRACSASGLADTLAFRHPAAGAAQRPAADGHDGHLSDQGHGPRLGDRHARTAARGSARGDRNVPAGRDADHRRRSPISS